MGKWSKNIVLAILICLFMCQMIPAAEIVEDVSLYELSWIAEQPSMTLRNVDGATDIYGHNYGRGLTGTASNVDNYGDYILDGKYNIFSGTVIRNAGTNPPVDLKDPYRTDICVSVYGDGMLLYASRSVNLDGNEIQEFSIDVTGVKTLRIAVNGKKYISLCNAVLLADAEEEYIEADSVIWSSMTQEYGSELYTSMNLWNSSDIEYYSDKEMLSFAAGSPIICYDDRVYYTDSKTNMVAAPLYSANRDGSDVYLIDPFFQNETKFAMSEGKLFYTRSNNYPAPSEVMCYDTDNGEISRIREGSLLCSGYGYLYITDYTGVYKINLKHPEKQIQVAAEQALAYTSTEIVRSTPVRDGEGHLEYSIYNMENGSQYLVEVPDTYTGGIYTPYGFAGDYLFVYGNEMISQYQISDGTLVQQIEADNEFVFGYGVSMYHNKKYASIFNTDLWHVFSGEANEWVADISPLQVQQVLYDWIKVNCKAITDWGFSVPQSASEFIIRNRLVSYLDEDAIYIGCETDPYERNDRSGNLAIQNVWIVKVDKDGNCRVVGSEFWQ